MLIFFAIAPILFMVVFLVFLNKPAKIIIPIALFFYFLISYFIWNIDLAHIISYSLLGIFKAFDIILIIFGAVLLLNVLKESGGLHTINSMFGNISKDKRVQLLIVGLLFEAFMEGVAGFGSPGVLAAPLLVTLGFPPLLAIVLGLMFDGIPVIFGAVGAPVFAVMNSVADLISSSNMNMETFASSFVEKTAFLNLILGSLVPLFAIMITIFYFGGNKKNKILSFIEIIPFVIYSSFAFLLPFYFLSKSGYDLPSILGSLIALSLVIFTTIKWNFLVPKNVWVFEDKNNWSNSWIPENKNYHNNELINKNISLFRSLLPYLLIAILLIVSRIPSLGISHYMKLVVIPIGEVLTWFNLPHGKFDFVILNNPGFFPFIFIGLFVGIFHKLTLRENIGVWKTTSIQLKSSAIILVCIFMITQLMIYSKYNNNNIDGMLTVLSKALAHYSGEYFLWISGYLGILGTFLGGSAAVSNILFASLQFETAIYTSLPVDVVIALQSTGAALATMVSINKIVAVSAAVGIANKEGMVLRITLIPLLVYIFLISLLSYILYL